MNLQPRFTRYEWTSAQWVEGQPLLINSDYDFRTALAVTGGPGLSYLQRIRANERTRELVAAAPQIDPGKLLQGIGRFRPLSQTAIAVYGMLFGADVARLQVAVEIVSDGGGSASPEMRFVYISDRHPVVGEGSWTGEQSALLRETFEEGLRSAMSMMRCQFT